MTMLSSSTPDLREGSESTLAVSSAGRGGNVVLPGCGILSHGGPIKDVVPRPGSAPATKFSDSDSAYEGGEEVDPVADIGDIFSVLSIDEDPGTQEIHHETNQDTDTKSAKPLELGTNSNIGQDASDLNYQPKTGKLGVFRSFIPAIAEMSSEDSDNGNRSNRLVNPPCGDRRNPPLSWSKYPASAINGNVGVDVKQRQVKSLQTPLLCVSTSDDTSSDSDDEVSRFAPPALHRNSGMYRRRHSLASTTPDQITRMLLSHRRGSAPGQPIPCADCFQTMHSKSASNHDRKPVEKKLSADSDKYKHLPVQSLSATSRLDSHKLFPQSAQTHRGTSGRRASFSVVTPRDTSLNSATHLRPVSPKPVTHPMGNDTSQRIAFLRTVSPRAVYPSSGNQSPRSLSPRPLSPRPRSPGLVRLSPVSPRDEIEMILSRTPPRTPPRSPSPRSPCSLSSSMSLTVSSQRERSRSPASRIMLSVIGHEGSNTASLHPRTSSRSPRPKQDRHGGSSRRPSYSNDIGESASTKNEPTKTQSSLGNTTAIHGKPNWTRSRFPAPHSLKPDHCNSRSASPQPSQRARSPKPTGHERRSSRRRSSLADIANKTTELTSLGVGSHSRRPSHTPRTPEDSDDSNFDQERVVMDRRKRRGSRGKILAMSDNQAASTAMRSRRSSICISHPTQGMFPPGPAERAHIAAKLSKRSQRRSSWAGVGEQLLPMTPVSAHALLLKSNRNAEEETDVMRDPYALTLHFITDPGQSHPLRKILRPLIESVVPKLKIFNFVERSESAPRDREDGDVADRDRPARVPTLGVVLLLQEEFGMERILEAQKYLKSEPWELHHRGKVGSNNVPYPTNNQDFYAHQTRLDSALWAVRQVHFGKDRLRFQLFVSDEMWAESISFYALLLSRPTHVQKEDFCYFLVFCSRSLNLEVQLALKKLPPGFKPQFLDSTILQFKVGDMGQLVPLLPRVCISISDKRWQTADPDGNKVLLFKDGDSCTTPITSTTPDPSDANSCPLPSSNDGCTTVGTPSRDTESPGHQNQEHAQHFDEWVHESNLVSAV